MNNILFMEKAFTEKYSKQNLPLPLKEQFLFPASAITERTVWREWI